MFFIVSESRAQKTDPKNPKKEKEEETKAPPKSQVETTVEYTAQDSMHFDVLRQTMYMYGSAKVTFGNKSLEADLIKLSWATNTVSASGLTDSLGNISGNPVFTEGGSTYNAREMVYNYKTEKGLIKGLVTEQGDGYVQGKVVKKTPGEDFYINKAIYTTCNQEHPHFGIYSSKLKMVPNKHVISGPFNLHVNDVPLPLGFPVGMFPVNNKRTSGVIMPQYGEQREIGFFLRNGGVFLAINDYMNFSLLGDIYSLGGWGSRANFSYYKRYKFRGNFDVNLTRRVQTGTDGLKESLPFDYRINWSHTPETRGVSRFSASVNISSQNFNRNNAQTPDQLITASISSSIKYTTSFFDNLFNFSANLRHNQNTLTNIATMSPDVGLSMQRIYPFRKEGSSKKNPITDFNINYTANARAELTNQPRQNGGFPFTVAKPLEVANTDSNAELDTLDFFGNFDQVLQNYKAGARHTISGGTNMTLLKYFNLSPGFSYEEYWYPQQYRYTWVDSLNAVAVDTLNKFSRAYSYNTSVGLATRFYMFYAVKGGIQVRHMITPTIGFSYRPDFSEPQFGMFQEIQTNNNGTTTRVAKIHGGNNGVPSTGKSASMSFGFTSQLEGKIKDRQDSTKQFKKITLLDNFSVNSSYNFAADSFQLAAFRFTARTTLFKKLNINGSGAIDPYLYLPTKIDETGRVVSQRKVNRFTWAAGEGLGTLTQFQLAVGTSFSASKRSSDNKKEKAKETYGEDDPILREIEERPDLYVDFNIPWSLKVDWNISYNRQGLLEPTVRQAVNFSGDFSFTPKWKFGFRSGYDFEREAFANTNFTIFRDLHCWQMNINWTPFGPTQGFTVDIAVRSSILQDLKISKRNRWAQTQQFR